MTETVMVGLDPATHAVGETLVRRVGGRDTPGHDGFFGLADETEGAERCSWE